MLLNSRKGKNRQVKMTELNKSQIHLLRSIEKYQKILKGTVQEIENYIFSYTSTPKDELPHFSSWPKQVSQDESDWITYQFLPVLRRYDDVPKQLIKDVRAANDILFELTELSGFDEHLDNKILSKKKIEVLFSVHDSLNVFFENHLLKPAGTEQGNKETKREGEGFLEPKPPETLQKALWILKYGRKHWKLILLVVLTILISSLFVLPKIELFSKNTTTNSENSRAIEFRSIPNTENFDGIKNLESMRMGISLSYVKSLFGIPIREHILKSGRREMLYAFKPYYLQIVTDADDLVVFFAVTLRDRTFKYKVPYISTKFILGEVTYSDFGEPEETYFNVGSKTAEYREKHYYGNPGYYMDFWPAFNDSGVNPIGTSNDDLDDSKICVVRDKELNSLRKKLRPNTIGIASMGYDGLDSEINEIGVGPCRLITRELE